MLGIIGGTGLYQLEGLKDLKKVNVTTPFGSPSAALTVGHLDGKSVVFLPRHGEHHELLPSEINYRANIFALKEYGVRQIISVSATGSLELSLPPGNLALASQYIDFTKGIRKPSFFGEGMVAHISSAEPTCHILRGNISTAAKANGISLQVDKAYACVEGPRLGTRAESKFLQVAGCQLVGMTNVPESFLAREAQICYATIAVVTDYDCWHEDPSQHVTSDKVMALYRETLGQVKTLLHEVILGRDADGAQRPPCGCRKALAEALVTPRSYLKEAHLKVLKVLES